MKFNATGSYVGYYKVFLSPVLWRDYFFQGFSFFNTCKKRTTRSRETFIDQWELNSLDQNLTDGPLHRIYGFIRSFGLDRGIDLGLQVEKLSKIYGYGSSQRQIQDFKTVVHHKKIGLCRGILLRCHVGEYTTLCHDVFGLSIAIHSDSLLYRELFLTDCMCGAIPIQGFIWFLSNFLHVLIYQYHRHCWRRNTVRLITMEYLCKRFMWLELSLVLWNPWNVRGITPSDMPCLFDKLLTLKDNPKPWFILLRSQLAGWTLTPKFPPKVEKMEISPFSRVQEKHPLCAWKQVRTMV